MSKTTNTTNTTPSTTTPPPFNKEDFIKSCGSKSAAIRKLAGEGKKRGEIAKLLEIRYQHVRNVLITPLKKVG